MAEATRHTASNLANIITLNQPILWVVADLWTSILTVCVLIEISNPLASLEIRRSCMRH